MTHFQFLLHLLFPQVLCIYLVFTVDFYQLRQCRLVMFHLVFVCVCVLSLFIVSVVYCLYSAVLVHHLLKVLYNTFAHSHLYTDGRGCHASCWPAQEVIELFLFRAPNNISTLSHSYIHTHRHTHTHSLTIGTASGSNLGFSVLPKDTMMCSLEIQESAVRPSH